MSFLLTKCRQNVGRDEPVELGRHLYIGM